MRITHPNYTLTTIDLTDGGSMDLAQAGQRLQIVRAESISDGRVRPEATISVALGHPAEDRLPLGMGGTIVGRVERYYLYWDAQPGVRMHVLVSQSGDAEGGILVQTPPTASLTVQDDQAWRVTPQGVFTAETYRRPSVITANERRGTYTGSAAWLVTPAENTTGMLVHEILSDTVLVLATDTATTWAGGAGRYFAVTGTAPVELNRVVPAGMGLYAPTTKAGYGWVVTYDWL